MKKQMENALRTVAVAEEQELKKLNKTELIKNTVILAQNLEKQHEKATKNACENENLTRTFLNLNNAIKTISKDILEDKLYSSFCLFIDDSYISINNRKSKTYASIADITYHSLYFDKLTDVADAAFSFEKRNDNKHNIILSTHAAASVKQFCLATACIVAQWIKYFNSDKLQTHGSYSAESIDFLNKHFISASARKNGQLESLEIENNVKFLEQFSLSLYREEIKELLTHINSNNHLKSFFNKEEKENNGRKPYILPKPDTILSWSKAVKDAFFNDVLTLLAAVADSDNDIRRELTAYLAAATASQQTQATAEQKTA